MGDRGFDARDFFFEEGAAVFHLLLLDGIQAAGLLASFGPPSMTIVLDAGFTGEKAQGLSPIAI